jgi:hypothetical protein
MDDSDRTESREPPVTIPEHLVFAIEEWLAERVRQACDSYDGDQTRLAVTEAVGRYEAFTAGSLTASQIAEAADGAADWLQPLWPRNQKEVEEVTRLLTATRGLLALRDRALAVARQGEHTEPADDAVHCVAASVVAADPELVEVLRLQTLLVLEANHEPLDEVRDLEPSELLEVASILRDAIAVLDTIGWLPTDPIKPMDLVISEGHLTQLRRRRTDIAMTILDRLDSREGLTEPDRIAEAEEAIAADHHQAHGLLRLLRACGRAS